LVVVKVTLPDFECRAFWRLSDEGEMLVKKEKRAMDDGWRTGR
jgi:hypothetical protein